MNKSMAYVGLGITFLGGGMGLYSNFQQPQLDFFQAAWSIALLLGAVAGTIFLFKLKGRTK